MDLDIIARRGGQEGPSRKSGRGAQAREAIRGLRVQGRAARGCQSRSRPPDRMKHWHVLELLISAQTNPSSRSE